MLSSKNKKKYICRVFRSLGVDRSFAVDLNCVPFSQLRSITARHFAETDRIDCLDGPSIIAGAIGGDSHYEVHSRLF